MTVIIYLIGRENNVYVFNLTREMQDGCPGFERSKSKCHKTIGKTPSSSLTRCPTDCRFLFRLCLCPLIYVTFEENHPKLSTSGSNITVATKPSTLHFSLLSA